MRLLDEMGSLAEGDLTIKATVTEDITGAIADSINYAIEALRELVATINDSAITLDAAAKERGDAVEPDASGNDRGEVDALSGDRCQCRGKFFVSVADHEAELDLAGDRDPRFNSGSKFCNAAGARCSSRRQRVHHMSSSPERADAASTGNAAADWTR